jgi:hypothetical protein
VTVEPVKEKDGNMVVNMEEAELSPLFAENDKECVPEVPV